MHAYSNSKEFLVAIPVYNEERHLESVLRQVRRYVREILIVDDGSTDGTAELLRQQPDLRLITHPENRGYGKSLADAFCYARRHGFTWLITMDCDEQHEASFIPRFQAAARDDGADIVSGTRYPPGQAVDASVPPDRREINRVMTALLNQRLGLGITDGFCGFKAYRVSTLCHFDITVPGYAMPMQLWVQAAAAGLRVRELPVRLIYNDATRHFGGMLDDPVVRLAHYREVFESEISARFDGVPSRPCGATCP